MEMNNNYPTPQWLRAVERCREDSRTIKDILVREKRFKSLIRLSPKLKFVDDFSAVIALALGAKVILVVLVWGSIRLILALVSSAHDTLHTIVVMLEAIAVPLTRFHAYENSLPMSYLLEIALVDAYTEAIGFGARTIHLFRYYPYVPISRSTWQKFVNDFWVTTTRIDQISVIVESEVYLARMRLDQYKGLTQLMDDLAKQTNDKIRRSRYNGISLPRNEMFSGRSDLLSTIHSSLDPRRASSSTRSVALYGMGGNSKTQVAL
ncbi:hypothetical protein M426DRAFT_116746 [Hypoxylon sp. CI-4A]|nr:hypothetical protein M426DRAFT_116746 [Hypoxylon sp. CI-4A]